MTLKGRLIFPILCLLFTLFVIFIVIDRGVFLNLDNGNNILFNIVCFILVLMTISAFLLHPREVFIDTEKLIVRPPKYSFISAKEINLKNVKYYKIQSMYRVPGYLMTFYSNDLHDKNINKKSVGFNIKDSDLDILIERLKTLNIIRLE